MRSATSLAWIGAFSISLSLLLVGCNSDGPSGAVSTQTASEVPSSSSATAAASTGSSSSSATIAGSTGSSSATAAGSTAAVSWVPPTTYTNGTAITNLAGYRIYYGTDQNNLNDVIDISNPGVTTYVIGDLPTGTWYFAVTAYSTDGSESALSDVATKTIT